MARILFVYHPYKAPSNIKGEICRWNTTLGHWRKLLHSSNAKYIEPLGYAPKNGDILFVGEWECCSKCTNCKTSSPKIFDKLHKPFITELDNWPLTLSTDPFVFGPRFYYSCCKIDKAINMVPGDIVIFGNYSRTASNKALKSAPKRIIVDTVMVLKEKIELLKKPERHFPYGYSHVTLSRLHPNGYIWEGKMYDDIANPTCDDTFSFVPCLPVSANGAKGCYHVPCEIPNPTFNGKSIEVEQNIGVQEFPNISTEDVFKDIVSKIATEGFCLGVRMPMPNKEEIYDILK